MKRAGSFPAMVLIGLFLLFSTTQAFASSLRYTGVRSISADLSINTSGTATCSASLRTSSSNYLPSLTATLKKSKDGKSWSYVNSWSDSGTYAGGAHISESVSVSSGYSYKLFVTGYVYTNSGTHVETASISSKIVDF